MTNAQFLLKKYSPAILTGLSMVGVVTTTILGIKATPKALKLIEEEKERRAEIINKAFYADNQKYEHQEKIYDEMTNLDIIKVAWKPYIPTIISCLTTFGTILSLHLLNVRTQTALTSAYATLNQLHQEYVAKTKELYGEDSDQKIREAITKDHIPDIQELTDGKQMFLDYQSLRVFESTIEDVIQAENQLNAEFAASGVVSINDFYELLGLEPVTYGQEVGWYDNGTYFEIEFENQLCKMDVGDDREDKMDVFIINTLTEPNIELGPHGKMLL